MKHILEHPEMTVLSQEVEGAVSHPDRAVQSQSDESTVLYYRLLGSTPFGVKWICVVVKYREDDAFVLTAYLTDRPKRGTQLWPGT